MIKILFFIEELSAGGAEKVLCDLVNSLDTDQFDITVQTIWTCDPTRFLRPGIQYRSCYGNKTKWNQLRFRSESALELVYLLHIRDRYDIECAYLECSSTKIIASSTNRRAKKVAWVHCDLSKKIKEMSDPEGFIRKASKWYKKFDKVVCVSENVKDTFCGLFGNVKKTIVLYNTIDDDAIRKKALLPLPYGMKKHRLTVLSVGRLTRQKDFLRLLRAHKQLLDEGIIHDVWILGDGPQRTTLERYIKENGLQSSVSMPGFIDNPYPFMREADLLVCSSVYEGYSTFLTEAIILGKPVVTTNVSGVHELLGNSEFGLIVENEDDAFYLGLKQMIIDIDRRTQYAKVATLRGKSFSARALTAKTELFFEEIMIG